MFLAGCQSANVQTLPTEPGKPTVQIPMWKSVCNVKKNNIYRPLREVVTIKPIDNPTCIGRKLHAGETGGYHRDEMRTADFPVPFQKETHVFEADVAITAKPGEERPVFLKQVHSIEAGHAGSIQVSIGSITIDGLFKKCNSCSGYSGRVTEYPAPSYQYPHKLWDPVTEIPVNPRAKFNWRFDGTVYHFKSVNEFDGTGGFWTHVYVDGEKIVSGYTNYPRGEGYEEFMKPKIYEHKFGIYGPQFDVEGKFSNVSLKYITAR